MRTVYIDLLFITNLIPDFLLLRLCARLCGIYRKAWRSALAAFFGALAALPLYFLPLPRGAAIPVKAALCALLCLIAFGRKRLLMLCSVFCALSFAFAGALLGLSMLSALRADIRNGFPYAEISLPLTLVASVFAYALLSAVFGQGSAAQTAGDAELCACIDGKRARFRALRDTGNTLRSPFSGKRVIVIGADVWTELFSPEKCRIIASYAAEEALSALADRRFSLVPCKTAQGSEMMLCAAPDELIIDGQPAHDKLLGLSKENIRAAGGCLAVMGV